ncbi:hypothetical protein M758_2G247600 [Ceratodon purpureus]|uniref:Uncharacterized protein n=1 Tax=Ceratodon purpureus TaxID=3225 RepID=A0A8T0J312_CERPU|nr:hypothetical protein KC19_2G293500 [Ceratodon purpureus]KAG0628067.1 hypothetical protein M758_2G247600 [Ceratodon purpureus]
MRAHKDSRILKLLLVVPESAQASLCGVGDVFDFGSLLKLWDAIMATPDIAAKIRDL